MSRVRQWSTVALLLIPTAACAAAPDDADGPPAGTDGPTATSIDGAGDTGRPTQTSTADASTAIRPPGLGAAAFTEADAAMERRVDGAGIGGMLLVVRDGEVVFERSYGGVDRDTPLYVASTAKWVSAATVLTVVDEGLLTLDDPISTWVPDLDGQARDITLRQLLSHTNGVKQQGCILDTSDTLEGCAHRMLTAPLEFTPGTAFSYGNAGFHVAGWLAELVTDTPFVELVDERIGEPLGMTGTTWGPSGTRNPAPASSMMTTVHDMAAFLQMNLDDGAVNGHQVLSAASIAEFRRNQVAGFDTGGDYAVGITRIPTYGFGTWRDVPDGDDDIIVMSGNGAGGYYPWIDPGHGTFGIVAVEDRRGAEVAVPASKVVMDLAVEATTRA